MSYRRAEEAAPLGGATSVTVCTNYLALGNLVEHVLPVATLQALRDREPLVPQVVELEDDRIGLSAVDAGMLQQKGDQVLRPLFNQRDLALSSGSDVSRFVRRVMLLLVLSPARSAVVVSLPACPPSPREFFDRLLPLAASTSPHKASI
ncbi:MAG: hypothetical protein ACTHO8_01580 [Solirubrobacterales bacterium]